MGGQSSAVKAGLLLPPVEFFPYGLLRYGAALAAARRLFSLLRLERD